MRGLRTSSHRPALTAADQWLADELLDLLNDVRRLERKVEELRATVTASNENQQHDAYIEPLDGGHRGYQARCWDCDWCGPERLRRGEVLGTPESRVHKNAARQDAAKHRNARLSEDRR